MTSIRNSHVLITGATGGFGQQLTRQLSHKGAKLLLADVNGTALEELASQYEESVTGVIASDLSTQAGSEALYKEAQAVGRPVDVLINNAGIAFYGRIDETPNETWEMLMDINLRAPMRLISHFLPDMIERRSGHIVNISSVAGLIGPKGLSVYAASKFGLRGFSEGLYEEVKQYNVKVTTVYPYFSRTPILDIPSFGSLGESRAELPENHITDPADVMAAVVKGIENNTQHVYPDRFSQIIQLLKRYAPRMLNRLVPAN